MENVAPVIEQEHHVQKRAPVRAGIKLRWMAMMIDILIIGMFTTLASKLLNLKALDANYVSILIYFPFSAYFHKELNATPGKILLGFVVMDAQNRPITWKASIIRSLAASISLMLYSAGHFISLFNKKKMAAHDFAAKTKVLIAEEKSSAYISLLTLIIVGFMFAIYYLKTGSLVPPGR